MLTIKNLTKRTVVFNLPHEFACSATTCTCSRVKVGVQEHDRTTGDRKVRAVNQRIAHSVTLQPRGSREEIYKDEGGERVFAGHRPLDTVEGLLNTVARVPEIKAAIARGEIEIDVKPDTKPAPAPAADPPKGDAKPDTKKMKTETKAADPVAVKE